MKEQEIRPYKVINGRNTQRALLGGLDFARAKSEKSAMERVLLNERRLLDSMNLVTEPLSEVAVNPNLTIFLDGPDGLGGYADVYAKSEWQEPGTRIEMEQEKEIMRDHLSRTLNAPYLEELRREEKPLVIIEGGAGPDLRTIGAVSDVLVLKAEELQGIPIQMVHVDISKRMAAITIAKVRTSGIPEKLTDLGLKADIAICHADVFDLLEKIPDNILTYALLPFGVLSFGLDGKNPSKILENIKIKLRKGGGTLATIYNTKWRDYTDVLEYTVKQINCSKDDAEQKIKTGDLNPFVIRILDGKMEVGGGLAFNCRTYTTTELIQLVNTSGLNLGACSVTPQGWAYWPEHLLNAIVKGNVFPNGLPNIPPNYLMDKAKDLVLDIIRKAGKAVDSSVINQLEKIIPDGKDMLQAPAPYITITAQK